MGGSADTHAAPFTLIGYRYSVYTWIVRGALHLTSTPYKFDDFDPFTQNVDTHPHPFGRVPVLRHGAVTLYETAAICSYLDAIRNGSSLMPGDALARARVMQVISIIDTYGYWPMIRQVFAQRVFHPFVGEESIESTVAEGLQAATPVLAALEEIATERVILASSKLTLADCHLAPMVDYFSRAREGSRALSTYPALSYWWERVSALDFLRDTDPLPNYSV
ncbi:glutathione S-transferase family protein [Tropicibacter sp. Alg240-R139]|uniref:glutathione S-transferase family protein n=1 Tax=Tropicibacter sp. Alg240-R139 TaxID=2305991 RepID=UPI0013DF5358|nr:glutathione S-transferase family protein [Tropicibacter sp. Alg240-R139]